MCDPQGIFQPYGISQPGSLLSQRNEKIVENERTMHGIIHGVSTVLIVVTGSYPYLLAAK